MSDLVSVKLTAQQAKVCMDALTHYADDRMRIARRRDRNERHLTGVSIEAALGDFFELCRETKHAIRDAPRQSEDRA